MGAGLCPDHLALRHAHALRKWELLFVPPPLEISHSLADRLARPTAYAHVAVDFPEELALLINQILHLLLGYVACAVFAFGETVRVAVVRIMPFEFAEG